MEWNWAWDLLVMLLAVPVLWLNGWVISCYFPFLLTARFYFTIKNPQLCRLLLSDGFNRSGSTRTRLEDRNKMPFLGVVYYITSIFLLVLLWASGGAHLYQLWHGASWREVRGIAACFTGCLAAVLGWMALSFFLHIVDYGLGKALHPDHGAAMSIPLRPSKPSVKRTGMKNGICAARNRKELWTFLSAGAAGMALGILFIFLELICKLKGLGFAVGLACIGSGGYLLCAGWKGLLFPKNFGICAEILCQLRPEEQGLSAKEMLALVDQDLAYAVCFARGKALIGKEWFYSVNTMGCALIRLENIDKIERQTRNDRSMILRLKDAKGRGVCVFGVSSSEADAVQGFLKGRVPNRRDQ